MFALMRAVLRKGLSATVSDVGLRGERVWRRCVFVLGFVPHVVRPVARLGELDLGTHDTERFSSPFLEATLDRRIGGSATSTRY